MITVISPYDSVLDYELERKNMMPMSGAVAMTVWKSTGSILGGISLMFDGMHAGPNWKRNNQFLVSTSTQAVKALGLQRLEVDLRLEHPREQTKVQVDPQYTSKGKAWNQELWMHIIFMARHVIHHHWIIAISKDGTFMSCDHCELIRFAKIVNRVENAITAGSSAVAITDTTITGMVRRSIHQLDTVQSHKNPCVLRLYIHSSFHRNSPAL